MIDEVGLVRTLQTRIVADPDGAPPAILSQVKQRTRSEPYFSRAVWSKQGLFAWNCSQKQYREKEAPIPWLLERNAKD